MPMDWTPPEGITGFRCQGCGTYGFRRRESTQYCRDCKEGIRA